MKESAKVAMNEIVERLKTVEVDNDNLLEEHRIDHHTDMIQNDYVNLVLGEDVIRKILSFVAANNESNYREFGTYFYGKKIENTIYVTGYTGTDFEESDGVYSKGAVDVTEKNILELEMLTSKIANPYNVVIHFHTHPDYVKDSSGNLIKPASNLFSENDLYSYAYHQVHMQHKNNSVVYIGGMSSNKNGVPEINLVFYDPEKELFCNINKIFYFMKNNLCKIENDSLVDTKVVDDNVKTDIDNKIRRIAH